MGVKGNSLLGSKIQSESPPGETFLVTRLTAEELMFQDGLFRCLILQIRKNTPRNIILKVTAGCLSDTQAKDAICLERFYQGNVCWELSISNLLLLMMMIIITISVPP